MDQQQPEPASGAATAGTGAERTGPRLDRLIAGGAEANAGNDAEGPGGRS
jgi:hypothetical protein